MELWQAIFKPTSVNHIEKISSHILSQVNIMFFLRTQNGVPYQQVKAANIA